ncbi:Glutaredoxin [Macleaya cordata]|uniref:Glutaredoxin n=1 Tax=Macleaya cordata TaxID=56857 RepID=A0A200PXX9_MACCD|nr:Glutaredoxin [Macleaya cordata]
MCGSSTAAAVSVSQQPLSYYYSSSPNINIVDINVKKKKKRTIPLAFLSQQVQRCSNFSSSNNPLSSIFHHHHPYTSSSSSSSFTTTTTWSNRIGPSLRCFSALTPELKTTLDKVVTSHKVVLFMKGTKEFPQCGFSNTVVQILKSLNVPFETLNILENELLRQALKDYSNWPTFPQLYIDGEFFGGCDITVGKLPLPFFLLFGFFFHELNIYWY